VIAERDRLREEVDHQKLIMAELESLRELLNDGPCAMALAVSTTNGHTPRQAADGFPLDSSRSNALDDTAFMPPDNTAAPDDREERPPADNGPLTCVKAAVPHERPPQGTLMERILTAIEASDKPLRGWRIQRELGLSRMPSAELSRLVRRGHLERLGEGIFAVAGREYKSTKSC
jgi:hypothetical protein